jgi:hypothetical protein
MPFDPEILHGGWSKRAADTDDEAWLAMATNMVNSLADLLSRSVSIDRGAISLGEGFSVDFRTNDRDLSLWNMQIRGIVGASVVKDRLLVRCWLFLYSGGRRMAPADAEYFELELVPEKGGTWRHTGWGIGFPAEFDSYLTFE